MTDRDNELLWKSYFYPGTNILINYPGIKDYEELKEFESTYSFERLLELRQKDLDMPIDKHRLNYIHKYIFEDIYPFAGKYRKANIVKTRGSFFDIDKPKDIDDKLDELFLEIEERLKKVYSPWDLCDVMAFLYTALIYYHPYREGNGRTIREFLREFSLQKSEELGFGKMELDWGKIDKEQLNEYVNVVHWFPSSITSLFEVALTKKEKTKR